MVIDDSRHVCFHYNADKARDVREANNIKAASTPGQRNLKTQIRLTVHANPS